MKDAFCIGCYPSNDILKKLLIDNIKSIRKNIYCDIFLSTHYPNIDKEIIDMVDYFIYDKNNDFVDKSHSPCTIADYANYKIVIYNGGHGLPVFRNINNLTKLSGSLGYKFFYYCEGDIVFSKPDIEKILEWKSKCNFYQKDLFMRSSNDDNLYIGNEDYASNVDLMFFGGNLDFWNKNIKLPHNNREWEEFEWVNHFENNQSIERVFYLKYKDLLRNQLQMDYGLVEYFNNSIFNGYSFKNLLMTPLYNITVPDSPMLLIHNTTDKSQMINVEIDDDQIFNHNVLIGEFHILPISYHSGLKIKMTCIDNDKILKQNTYKIDSIKDLMNIGDISIKQ